MTKDELVNSLQKRVYPMVKHSPYTRVGRVHGL